MPKELFNYNDNDINSILEYSQMILGKNFKEILKIYQQSPYKTYEDFQTKTISTIQDKEVSIKSKRQYGNYIEKYFYGYNPNNDAVADFPKVGIELKVTPFKVNKNNSISAKERLVLTYSII